MAKHIKEICLDYDGTYTEKIAKLEDGFTLTKTSLTSISQPCIFPMAPAVPISLDNLFNMETPPTYIGDVPSAYIKFGNAFLPVGSFTEDEMALGDRGRREAQAHIRIQRQKRQNEAMAKHNESISESFRLLVITACITGIVAVLVVGVVVLLKGDKTPIENTDTGTISRSK